MALDKTPDYDAIYALQFSRLLKNKQALLSVKLNSSKRLGPKDLQTKAPQPSISSDSAARARTTLGNSSYINLHLLGRTSLCEGDPRATGTLLAMFSVIQSILTAPTNSKYTMETAQG